jgi:antirestriction protein ArdC
MPYGGVAPILLNIAGGALGCEDCPWWGSLPDWNALKSRVPFGVGAWIPGCSEPLQNWKFTDQAYEPPPLPAQDPEAVFDAIIKALGVKMEYVFSPECKYLGAEDKIRMSQKWLFEIGPGGPSGYYDSLGHELMHATEPRLKWDGHSDVAELRAEVGAGYLCGLLGVAPLRLHLRRHHDAHVGRWIRQMKADPGLLLRVCDSASEGVVYLLRLAGMEIKWHSPET